MKREKRRSEGLEEIKAAFFGPADGGPVVNSLLRLIDRILMRLRKRGNVKN